MPGNLSPLRQLRDDHQEAKVSDIQQIFARRLRQALVIVVAPSCV